MYKKQIEVNNMIYVFMTIMIVEYFFHYVIWLTKWSYIVVLIECRLFNDFQLNVVTLKAIDINDFDRKQKDKNSRSDIEIELWNCIIEQIWRKIS